jgi:YHS domain-containing protein
VPRKLITSLALVAALQGAAAAQDGPVPTAPPFNPPQLQPSLLDFLTGKPVAEMMKLSKTDPLLRPPFAGAPIDTPKGLAADIKAKELDVPNRIAAARYLGTLDCVAFPEARQMLIAMALEDPFEPVRYEAVMALRVMLSRGMENPQRSAHIAGCGCQHCKEREKQVKKIAKETHRHQHRAEVHAMLCPPNPCDLVHQVLPQVIHAPCEMVQNLKLRCQTGVPPEALRYDWCRGCCDAETLNALSKIAYDRDEQGCPLEPSPRVREAAASALLLCDCIPKPYVPVPVPEPAPAVPPPAPPVEGDLPPLREGDLPRIEEPPPELFDLEPMASRPRILETSSARPAIAFDPFAVANRQAPPLSALDDYCIVSLTDRKFEKANPAIRSVYKGRTFFFSTDAAKARFDAAPERFAPAFLGMDPVVYVATGEVREGHLLREYGGRFYLFVSEKSWQTFQQNPTRFAAR